jgi:hypothetical protein
MHTKDILADELMKLGLMDMSLKARGGYYHDYLSPLATPEMELIRDLAEAAKARKDKRDQIMEMRSRAINGAFDATREESDEWAESEEGQEIFQRLIDRK